MYSHSNCTIYAQTNVDVLLLYHQCFFFFCEYHIVECFNQYNKYVHKYIYTFIKDVSVLSYKLRD